MFERAMNINDSFVRSRSKTVEFFHQPRLIRITNGTVAIWLPCVRALA